MNMIYSYGCTSNELSVNGIQEVNMTNGERKAIIHRIMNWYENHLENFNDLLQYFIETHAEDYDMSEPCEQCGDCVCTYRMTI